MFASDNPYRYIFGSTCTQWDSGMKFCLTKTSYSSLYVKGDEDIEYYDDDEETVRRQNRRSNLGPYLKLARGREIREQVEMGHNGNPMGNLLY